MSGPMVGLKIAGDSLPLPIAIARGLGAVGTADFLARRRSGRGAAALLGFLERAPRRRRQRGRAASFRIA